MKQLGKKPFFKSRPMELDDFHGGEWDEWPEELRVRELPWEFYASGTGVVANLAKSNKNL